MLCHILCNWLTPFRASCRYIWAARIGCEFSWGSRRRGRGVRLVRRSNRWSGVIVGLIVGLIVGNGGWVVYRRTEAWRTACRQWTAHWRVVTRGVTTGVIGTGSVGTGGIGTSSSKRERSTSDTATAATTICNRKHTPSCNTIMLCNDKIIKNLTRTTKIFKQDNKNLFRNQMFSPDNRTYWMHNT